MTQRDLARAGAYQKSDPAHDILRTEPHPLEAFFAPKTVAIIGATERKGHLGERVLQNFVHTSSPVEVFPVTPTHSAVLGMKAYASVLSVPSPIDLAVIITPAKTVPGIIEECVAAHVRAAIIISSGFRETGPKGQLLEKEILQKVDGSSLRLIGPNCIGVMNPHSGLNATFSQQLAHPGSVAFISQSGALCTAILDWSLREMVGFSAFVSTGSMLDVDWGDLIDYFGDDEKTKSILLYIESIGDARSFLSAAREVSLTKPIIVIKAGRTEEAAKAAASHTGSLTGSDEVFDAACRRAGVLRVETVSELFYMTEVLSKQPRPKGPRLAIVTNAGGPAVLAADALIGGGGELPNLSEATRDGLDAILPSYWSHGNPIDLLGDAKAETFGKAMTLVSADGEFDAMLAITAPQGLADPAEIATSLAKFSSSGKPILASFMGGPAIAPAEAILREAGIPTFPFPDEAARAFNYMWKYSYNLRGLYETPSGNRMEYPESAMTDRLVRSAIRSQREILSEWESKQILASYGIPVVETRIAYTPDEAVELAKELGYPVVLKLHSKAVTHKSDVGGVQLDLQDERSVREAYRRIEWNVLEIAGAGSFLGVTVQPMVRRGGLELILGSSIDAQFGPVLLFGAGGEFVEVFRDRALALPPLNTTLARRMMEQTRIWQALKGVRGRKAVDLPELESILVRFSQLVITQPWIKEIDINPLVTLSEGRAISSIGASRPTIGAPERPTFVALDARIILHRPGIGSENLPVPAIRPYPTQYIRGWSMRNGQRIGIRPILPEDEPAMIRFHGRLSERSVYLRYFQPLKMSVRIAHERLTRICFIDYDREMVLVAEKENASSHLNEIVAVARLTSSREPHEAECALLVSDEYQNLGLGTELLRRLIAVARTEKVQIVRSSILPENEEMLAVANKLGFVAKKNLGEPLVRAELKLN